LSEDEAVRLAEVANHLNCFQSLFVTPAKFPQANDFFPKVKDRCKARVEWWKGEDIFDQSTRELMGVRQEVWKLVTEASTLLCGLDTCTSNS
jgi:hypothetical protein